MIDKENLPYRKCVGICLINQNKLIFVGQRIDSKSGAWQMPQGGVEEGETYEQAALRELGEEVGTSNVKILAKAGQLYSYDLPDHLIPTFWHGQFRGQEQQWFLAKLAGDESEINIATEEPEFREWAWMKPENMIDLIVPFKRELYGHILDEFIDYL